MALRVIQWATGGLGRAAIAGVAAHRDLELVGAWVHSPDKVGRDAGEVTGDPSSRVTFHGWHPASIEAGRERNPGIVATANHCVSAIPAVCAAPPGIASYLDLPSSPAASPPTWPADTRLVAVSAAGRRQRPAPRRRARRW